ncbi:Lysine histidine transporter 1 [Dichanthelium oligosanthes]|uniref:Lysine histidine transporter 1 n=1 Tax=Dichanthelium oligosanthes TaxID=888268 RepID=A0A1E5US39_9POAL|nr:Lysine histidine transporter 1 [Dichanthelium oligosanthes]
MEIQPLGDYSPDKFATLALEPKGRMDSQEGHWREQERSIDDWLPINARRNAKWWYSAFHNVTAMVGAGVLSLPYAMSELGWGAGVTVLLLSWIITLYTLWQMVEMHEMVPGKRFDRYHELGQHAFGEKLGLWIVVPQQLVVEVGLNIVYMVTGGQSLQKFHDVICPDCKHIKLTYFIMIFASAHFVLSQLPNFHSISRVSLAAAVMSLCYSTIAWIASVSKGKSADVDYNLRATTTPGKVFGFFGALGDVAFAYAGHNVVLEIQASIPSTPEKPSKKPMWKGVIVAYIIVAVCYFPPSLVGYWAFGNKVDDNILVTLNKPKWLIALANMMVVVHLLGSYQVYAMPVFDMIETVLVRKFWFRPGLMLRLIARTAYVAFTMFVAITFPFFNELLSFFGGFAFAPTTYFVASLGLAPNDERRTDSRQGSWSAEEKAIDDWLPINDASRNAKWWYSAFHNVTAMVGAGVLGLPYAMSELGWGAGITVLLLSWIITLYTLWQMVEMHEMVPGRRFDRYHELGQHAFGEKLGLWIVVPQQLVVEVGLNIVYMVTAGQSLQKFHDVFCRDTCRRKHIKLTYFIMIFASAQFVLSQLPNFHSISGVSLAAAIMSLCYSTIAWVASAEKGRSAEVDYDLRATTPPGRVFGFFGALGDVAFAYAGHNVVLEIQATIPSTPEKPSKKPMWKGVVVAYIVVAACYFPASLVGYWAFGNHVDENILVTLEKPRWLIAMANMMVVVHLIGSYQVYAMPVFDMIEMVLVRKLRFPPGLTLRLIARTLYVGFTMFVAITFPFFSALLSFFGGFAFAPTTYFLPCIMWLTIYKPKRFSLSWFTNWICIILGVLLMILSPIGGLRQIILKARTYKFYQ